MSNPYLNLSLEEIESKISESIGQLETLGIDEAAIDKMILAERRKLDPYAPQTRTEFEREWSRKEDMKWYERVGAGLAQTPEMFKYVFGTLGGAMVDQAKFVTDPFRGLKSLAEGGARGTRDLWEMVKGIGGEIGDWGRGREDHINREYQRYLDSLEYQRVRDAGILFDQDEVFEDYTEATSLILDPSNFIPFSAPGKVAAKVARKGVKTTAKAGAKVAGGVRKVGEVVAEKASLPRKKFADFLNDVARMHPTSAEGASVAGTLAAAVSSVPLVSPVGKALLGAEAAGIGAKVGGEMAEGVLNALASDNVAKRFLTRIAESPDVPMTARRLANFARKNGGQWALDKAYNTILAGVEIGTINGALQWAATGDPEGFGAGVAQGIAMSPIIGLAMPNNAGLSAQDRVDYATQNFIDTNGTHLQQLDLGFSRSVLEDFGKTPEGRRTLEVLGALDGLAPELNLPKLMHFFDEGTYNEIASNPKTDGEYNPATKEIFIKVKKDSANTVAASGLHEVGHYILANILETNPAARDFLINELTRGDKVTQRTGDNVYLPTKSNDKYSLRELTTEAAEFKKRYEYRVDEKGNIKLDEEGNPIRRGPDIDDLETLAQEMGAETIGELLYGTTPTGLLGLNNHALRGAALSAVSQLLSRLMPWRDTSGTAEPGGFARLDPNFKGLPILRDLFNNYRKVRQTHLDWRTRLEEMDGVIKSKDGKTARELVVNIAPDTQLFDTKDLEAMDGAYGKQLRQAHKAEPPASNEASVGPRVKGDRASGIGEKLSSATKKFFSNILSKSAMDLIEDIEAQIKTRRVIGGWYSKRADKRGNNELTYREMVPYGIGLSTRGNLILYGWNLNKLHDAIILAEEMGLVTGRTLDDGTKLSAADVLRERIKAASDRQARGERIADELVAALFGARYARDTQIKDTRHIEFARELNRRRAHPSQTLRVDTMQGFRRLDKDGFMFNWVDISNNNRPNRPARASGRAAVGRAVAEALAMPERVGYVPERFMGPGETTREKQPRRLDPPAFFKQFDLTYAEGGRFLDLKTGEDLTNKTFAGGQLSVSAPAKINFSTSDTIVDSILKSKDRQLGSLVKTNLYKQKAGWKWLGDSTGKPETIISIEKGKDHFYSLQFATDRPLTLATYPKEKFDPRGRPTTRGDLSFGNIVGQIKTNAGKIHNVYDTVQVVAKGEGTGSLASAERMTQDGLAKQNTKNKDDQNVQIARSGIYEGQVRGDVFRVDPPARGDDFLKGIRETYRDHPIGKAVTVKEREFYRDPSTGLFLSKDSKAGMAVTDYGDLVSVYKHPTSNANVREILAEATQYAKTLDAYDVNGFLPNLYSEFGFKPVARVKFNREYAPEGWPYELLGEPDIVTMVKDTEGTFAPIQMQPKGFDAVRDQLPYRDDAWEYTAELSKNAEAKPLASPEREAEDVDLQVSTRNPTAKKLIEDPIKENLVVDLATIMKDPKILRSYSKAVLQYPGIKRESRSPKKIIGSFIDFVVDNLLYLHDSVAPEIRERSKLWYDGAREITERWGEEYAIPRSGVAAALAALSPQKDWFMNVDLARRTLDIMRDQQETVFTQEMADFIIPRLAKKPKDAAQAKTAAFKKKHKISIEDLKIRILPIVGKKLKDLEYDNAAAIFVRAFDEMNNPRDYQVVSPEGDFIGQYRKKNGELGDVAWGSMSEISKAVKVIRDPSKENISVALGNAHKIRNFYNNILLPQIDKKSITADTHAIAAALLRPLAGSDLEVSNNFGAKPKNSKVTISNSKISGITGTYGIYAEAYRIAAAARDLLPREMQSITWEAVRGLFPDTFKKSDDNKQAVDNVWSRYEKGELTIHEAREQVIEIAGGIEPPEWYGL